MLPPPLLREHVAATASWIQRVHTEAYIDTPAGSGITASR